LWLRRKFACHNFDGEMQLHRTHWTTTYNFSISIFYSLWLLISIIYLYLFTLRMVPTCTALSLSPLLKPTRQWRRPPLLEITPKQDEKCSDSGKKIIFWQLWLVRFVPTQRPRKSVSNSDKNSHLVRELAEPRRVE
jgi:hypothetical protein